MRKRLICLRKSRRGDESGQAVLEFALVVPLLLVILMGVLDFGWIFMNQYRVEHAAATAARYGAINTSSYKTYSTRQNFLRGLVDKVSDNLPEQSNGSILCVDEAIGSLPGNSETNRTIVQIKVGTNSVSVTVSYPVRTLTFIAGSIYGEYYQATSTSVSSY